MNKYPIKEEMRLERSINAYMAEGLNRVVNGAFTDREKQKFIDWADLATTAEDRKLILSAITQSAKRIKKGVREDFQEVLKQTVIKESESGKYETKAWINNLFKEANNWVPAFDKFSKLKRAQTEELRAHFGFTNAEMSNIYDKWDNKGTQKFLRDQAEKFGVKNKNIRQMLAQGLDKLTDENKAEFLLWNQNRNALLARNEAGNFYAENLKQFAEDNDAEFYKWHTVGDSRVRESHAMRNNQIFSFYEGIVPGEDWHCRCWAEPMEIKPKKVIPNESGTVQAEATTENKSKVKLDISGAQRETKPLIKEAFENAPDDIKTVVNNYVDRLELNTNTYRGGPEAYYTKNNKLNLRPGNIVDRVIRGGSINMSKGALKLNDAKYVFTHEFGHFVDNQLGGVGAGAIENISITGKFAEAVKDYTENFDKYFSLNDVQLKKIIFKNIPRDNFIASPIYDILGGLSSKSESPYTGSFTHSKAYWKTEYHINNEVFANIFSVYTHAGNNELMAKQKAILKQHFPNLIEAFEEIIKEAIKNPGPKIIKRGGK